MGLQCPVCGKGWNNTASLERHLRSHTGERPFHCTRCPYRSITKDKMVRHMRKHTGDKPFRCQLCPYAAVQRSDLVKHVRSRHASAAEAALAHPYASLSSIRSHPSTSPSSVNLTLGSSRIPSTSFPAGAWLPRGIQPGQESVDPPY